LNAINKERSPNPTNDLMRPSILKLELVRALMRGTLLGSGLPLKSSLMGSSFTYRGKNPSLTTGRPILMWR
jgi:hypothetical protein